MTILSFTRILIDGIVDAKQIYLAIFVKFRLLCQSVRLLLLLEKVACHDSLLLSHFLIVLHTVSASTKLVLREHLPVTTERESVALVFLFIVLLIVLLLVECHFPQAQSLLQPHFFEAAGGDSLGLRLVFLHKPGLMRQKHQIRRELTVRFVYVCDQGLGFKFVFV